MAGLRFNRWGNCAKFFALAIALLFVTIQSGMLRAHAASSDTATTKFVQSGVVQNSDHGHAHDASAMDQQTDQTPHPEGDPEQEICKDLCCISGCTGFFLFDKTVNAVSLTERLPPVFAFDDSLGQSSVPPVRPPRA